MPRTHKSHDEWGLPEGTPVPWEALFAVDRYLLGRVPEGYRNGAHFTDTRGTLDHGNLRDAQEEWSSDPNPGDLKRIYCGYGVPDALVVDLHLTGLLPDRLYPAPSFSISAEGPDAAEVRGIVQEALDIAKRFSPPAPTTPSIGATPPPAPMPAVEKDLESVPKTNAEKALPAPAATAVRWYNHAWTIQVIGGLIAGMIILVLTLWLT